MPTVVSAVDLNRHSGDILSRIRLNGDQFVIEWRGEPVAALISYKVYQLILPELEKAQDLADAQAAHEDWLAGKGRPFEEFLAELEAEEAEQGEEVIELKGVAASAGVVEGRARVLKLLEEIVTLEPGEIMVAGNTDPAWAPVFSKIKAAVTDIGGIASHTAIVSREYSLPAVTGTGTATSVIRTGDIVRVDGDRGVVAIVKRANA